MQLLTAISAKNRNAARAIALWLGLFALMVQSLAPAYAAVAGPARGGESVVICTAHGFQTVRVDAEGNAVTGKASANIQDCCSDCQVAGGFLLPTPISVSEPFRLVSAATILLPAQHVPPRFFSPYITRGPPLVRF